LFAVQELRSNCGCSECLDLNVAVTKG